MCGSSTNWSHKNNCIIRGVRFHKLNIKFLPSCLRFWLWPGLVGDLLDHPYNPRARFFLCELWNQPLCNIIRWSGKEGGGCVQARKVCDHPICQSGTSGRMTPLRLTDSTLFADCISNLRFSASTQSSKCRSVFASAQKVEGYKRLDRQLAQFNDYNFVFTSYAKKWQQNQHKWGSRLETEERKRSFIQL